MSSTWSFGATCLMVILAQCVAAPTGCTETSTYGTCDFRTWSPPLLTSDFSTAPCFITVNYISGTLAANSFSGLSDCGDPSGQKSIALTCSPAGSTLVIDTNAFAGTLSWITELTITDCAISGGISSTTISGLSGLLDFILSGGSVASLAEDTFTGLTMNSVQISGTTITAGTFPSGFLTNAGSSMTKITLSNAGLTSIPSGAFSGKTAVTGLNIANNQLTTLYSNAFDSLVSLTTLSITGNSWECTCSISYLVKWIQYTGVTTDGEITCSSPSEYSGKNLKSVTFAAGCESTSTADDESLGDKFLKYSAATAAYIALVLAIAVVIVQVFLLKTRKENPQRVKRTAVTPEPKTTTSTYNHFF